MHFGYAVQINLLNGQKLNEYADGIDLEARPWGPYDSEQYPQAEKCLAANECLVVDRETRQVYAVDVGEAVAAGLNVDHIELDCGAKIRCGAI